EVLKNYCKKKKIECTIWKKNIESDVQELAKTFASDLNEKKIKKPVILISGGESTVNIKGKGKGGRNQEFALHLAKEIKKNNSSLKYTLLSAGTDGKDGPTNAAGAIVNQNSINLIEQKGINLNKELDNNNSYEVLQKINSLVIIDGTNTNVADIQLLALI
ncbi:MAG: D-glycerate 2-kinase, partial [Alphaproteobacteria bacterium MarineAlpha8_Bin1]